MSHRRESFDVAVIGLGAMGAATVFELSRRRPPLRVLGLEQHSIPHALGSHHGDSRMIRLCYYEHPSYVPLLRRAYELWRDLEKNSGRKALHVTGGLYMGPANEPAGELVPGTVRAAIEHGLSHERLTAAQLRARYPMFNVPDEYEGVIEPQAGFLRPEVAIEAFADLALRNGAMLKGHETVQRWSVEEKRIVIETSLNTYMASRLILCRGAWTRSLMVDMGIDLVVTRQTLGWFWPRRPELFQFGRFPVWGLDDQKGGLAYGFPITPGSGRPGLKIARHLPAEPTTPDGVDRLPTERDRHEIEELMTGIFPDHVGPLLSLTICLYTNTPDAHFIIDTHPRYENVTVATGFSGHGFKFASIVGEILADLALDGGTRHPIDFLRSSRLGL